MENEKKTAGCKLFFAPLKGPKDPSQWKLRKLGDDKKAYRKVADEIHTEIDINPVMGALIDTPHFQRLRSIKQLGTTFLTYPCGNHTRFEHSLGVAHLARKMAENIHKKQSYLKTTRKDILCITLAGLLHDIGHGPFSHVFEVFRGEMEKDLKADKDLQKKYEQFPTVPPKWSHEHSSLFMIDALLRYLGLAIDLDNLDEPLKQIGEGVDARSMRASNRSDNKDNILTSRDWVFIKECIFGGPIPDTVEKFGTEKLIGREEDKKEWLYFIVSNSQNGIDVDKIDYFARDQRRTLAEVGKINISMIDDAMVAKADCCASFCSKCKSGDKHYMICYPDKRKHRIREFFKFRNNMHETVYQHKTTTAGDNMIVDIFKKADLEYPLLSTTGKKIPISRSVVDEVAFLSLRDNAIDAIAGDLSEGMNEARELARRLTYSRTLYKFAGEFPIDQENNRHMDFWRNAKNLPKIVASMIAEIPGTHSDGVKLEVNDIIIACCSWHHGKKGEDPTSFVRYVKGKDVVFSDWEDPQEDEMPEASQKLDRDYQTSVSKSFLQHCVRVYCRDSSKEKRELLQHKFAQYIENLNLSGMEDEEEAQPATEFAFCAFATRESSDEEEEDDEWGNHPAVQLTQDSEPDYTPEKLASRKRDMSDSDVSPIPAGKIPKFHYS